MAGLFQPHNLDFLPPSSVIGIPSEGCIKPLTYLQFYIPYILSSTAHRHVPASTFIESFPSFKLDYKTLKITQIIYITY